MNRIKSGFTAVHCLAVALSLASSVALAEKKYGPGVTGSEIKIGQTYPYSGPLSAYATIARTEAAIFAKLNAEGGQGRAPVSERFRPRLSPGRPRRLRRSGGQIHREGGLL